MEKKNTMDLARITVMNRLLFDGDIPSFYKHLLPLLPLQKSLCIAAADAHVIYQSIVNRTFLKDTINKFYVLLPDGMPLVLIAKIKGSRKIKRCYGPDFFRYVIQASSQENIRHFFCGGKPGVAIQLAQVCKKQLLNDNIVGTYSPPFRDLTKQELQTLADKINKQKTDILWIGISCPKQERLAIRLRPYLKIGCIITVGAAFDFHTGNQKQAPKWIQKLSLEWAFRICVEPRRLAKRYAKVVPTILLVGLWDIIIHVFRRKK